MSYFGVSTRNGVGLGLGTVPSLTNTPLGYRLAPSLDLSFAGSDALSPAITFSRTTNATLTNSAGLVANAPMNLLTFSEQFDNAAWTKAQATVTANAIAAPDGTLTADLVSPTAVLLNHGVFRAVSASAGVHTLSVYAKAQGASKVLLYGGSTGYGFDLANGTMSAVTGISAAQSYSITEAGSGWYRCSITVATAPTEAAFLILETFASISYAGNVNNGIFIWGAQLELGSTATTYNPTTVKNLLGFTENFDNAAWTKSNATISATKVDDIYGQPFAQKLVEDTATNFHQVLQNVTVVAGTPYALSVYAKAGERNWMCVYEDSASSKVWFDLSTGTVGTVVNATANIQSLGNGWYRCTAIYTQSGTVGRTRIAVASANGTISYTGDGTSGIYIFGAQLSDSASVDPYVYQPVAAPSSVAYYGPRFDYDPVTLAPKGLLIEEQRTNLLLNSAVLNTQVVTTTATAHTLSFYGTGTIVLSGASTGTVVGTGAYPTRTTLTFTPIVGVLTVTVTGSVTMAQLEAGAFATSYIPTVASQVTRAADSASMIGNNFARWYNQNTGTFMVQGDTAKPTTLVATAQLVTASDGTANNSHRVRYITAGIDAVTVVGGATQVDTNEVGYTANVSAKVAYAYQLNDYGFTVNGGTVQTITSATVPVVNSLQLGGFVANATPLNGHLQRFAYYNRRLSNTELQGITS